MCDKVRETGWSPIYCRRRLLRRFAPSKKLLLQKEISDDNAAYNGEVAHRSLVREFLYALVQWINDSLEDQKNDTIIPWEVDL
jgi:hypothetical protein